MTLRYGGWQIELLHCGLIDDGLYDRRAEVALATRNAFLDEVEARGATVIASHIEAPGRIERRNGGPVWVDLR